MKTNRRLIELYFALQDAAQKGTLESKILMFKNIKRIEDIVYPLLESKKVINKMLNEYQNKVAELYREFKVEFVGNQPTIPKYLKNEDGTFDTSRIDPRFIEFQEKDEALYIENKETIKKHKKEVESYEELMDTVIDLHTLQKLAFLPVPAKLIPRKTNGDDDINSLPLLEFGIIEISDSKTEKPEKTKK